MAKLPALRPRDVIGKLKKAGFYIDHQTGSHVVLYNARKHRRVTVAFHHKDLKPKTLQIILKQAGLGLNRFIELK